MGSMVVVSVQPVGRHFTHLLQAVEDVAIEHLGTVGLVESFDIGVLRRLSELDGACPNFCVNGADVS